MQNNQNPMKTQLSTTFDINLQTRTQLSTFFKIIFEYNGILYGGFVRDCVVPNYINHKNFNIIKDPIYNFKDINVWVTSLSDLVDILSRYHDMDNIIDIISKSQNIADGDLYELTVYRFNFCDDKFEPTKFLKDFCSDNNSFIIEFIVSNECPVNDFYTNMLMVRNMTENSIMFRSGSTKNNIGPLIRSIQNKLLEIKPFYLNKLVDHQGCVHRSRLLNRYLARGWRIRYNDKILNLNYPVRFPEIDADFEKILSSFKNDNKNTFDIVYKAFEKKWKKWNLTPKYENKAESFSDKPVNILDESLCDTLDLLNSNHDLLNSKIKLTSVPYELNIGGKKYKIYIKVEQFD